MRVLGKFMGGNNSWNFAVGSYAAFDVAWVIVETYTGSSIKEDNRCFLSLGAAFLVTNIKSIDGEYINPEIANALVKDIATKDTLDLDKYGMAFFGLWDIRPDSICIRNEVDKNYNTIPLEVIGV